VTDFRECSEDREKKIKSLSDSIIALCRQEDLEISMHASRISTCGVFLAAYISRFSEMNLDKILDVFLVSMRETIKRMVEECQKRQSNEQ
jgi:hypothetical protein